MNGKIVALIVVAVLGIGVVSAVGYVVTTRNGFVMMQEDVKARFAQVDNQLKRRADLIPNLVNTVKGYAAHEKEILTQLADARARMAGAKGPKETFDASNQLSSALARLLVVVERYPQLKADASFNRLMDELSGTENRIAVERKRYNDGVQAYNTKLKLFPASMIAGMFNFEPATYYEVPEKDKELPKVDFGTK